MNRRTLALALTFGAGLFAPTAHASTAVTSIASDTTWTAAGNPYLLDGRVDVEPAATLTIGPGVEVVAQPRTDPNAWKAILWVRGALHIQGTAVNPVVFRSGAATPAPGDWEGITVPAESAGASIDHLQLTDGFLGVGAQVNVSVTNSVFRNLTGGVQLEGNKAWNSNISSNTFEDTIGPIGVAPSGSGTITINDNTATRASGNAGITANVIGNVTVNVARNKVQNGFRALYLYSGSTSPDVSTITATNNTLLGNTQGAWLGKTNSGILNFTGNTLINNGPPDLSNIGVGTITATGNWWGTTDPTAIAQRVDGTVDASSPLTAAHPSAPSYPQPETTPGTTPTPTPTTTSTDSTPTDTTPGTTNTTPTTPTTPKTSTRLGLPRPKVARHTVTITGTVGVQRAALTITLTRKGRKTITRRINTTTGRYTLKIKSVPRGRWKITVRYAGSQTRQAATRTNTVTIPR